MLFGAAAAFLRERGIMLLTVKTLAPTKQDPNYALTRRFYEKIGFLPVEVFASLWGRQNPCILMIKLL